MILPHNSLPAAKTNGLRPAPLLTAEQVEAAVNALPIQGRIMLHLLLLQYLDLTQEDIDYMAADRPDPRFASGGKSTTPYISHETLQSVTDRAAQYRFQVRQKRERAWLKTGCLRKQIALTESLCSSVRHLLLSRFEMSQEAVRQLSQQARTAVSKPVIRELDRRWDTGDITEEEYRRERLAVEYQLLLRKLERERKRLETATREFEAASQIPLQDHEIGHIWGIPAGTLSARKVKYLHQYLQAVQAKVQATQPVNDQATTPPLDLWKETFAALSHRPVERSVAEYDGLEGTETTLIEKLTAFAAGTFPEETETRFWLSLVQESSHATEYGNKLKSLFPLQRLHAILSDIDTAPATLEAELLHRVSPKPKAAAELPEHKKPEELPLGELGEHVLRSFLGEEHPDTRARR